MENINDAVEYRADSDALIAGCHTLFHAP